MDILEARYGEAVLLTINGRLDSVTSPTLEQKLLAFISGNVRQFILNFSAMEYISSAGLRILLMAAKKLKPVEGVMVLCGLQDHVREVFDLAGFSPLFPIYDSQEAALKHLT